MLDHTDDETTTDGPDPAAPPVTPETVEGAEGENGGPESWNLDSLPPELDYFRSSEAYQVELTGFQGPMDLLLHLIDREQVDIYDIPISRITEQFMTHIDAMQTIDAPVNAHVIGFCYSACAAILVAGTGDREAASNSLIMVHANLDDSSEPFSYERLYRTRYEAIPYATSVRSLMCAPPVS